jgi:FlgN protein
VDDRDELSRRLWLLREQMEQLVCALDIQQLVLANDRLRWLPMVTENVEHLVDDIRESEAQRADVSKRVARQLGLDEHATLSDLARTVEEPYAGVWRQHRLHLLGLQAEVEDITNTNRELGRRGMQFTRDAVTALTGDSHDTTYDPRGVTRPLTTASRRFDRTA